MIDHHPYLSDNIAISLYGRFWLFLISFLPSFIFCVIVLYHLLRDRTRRRNLNNHLIIVLLFNTLLYELLSIPIFLAYYYVGILRPASPALCLFWTFIDSGLFTLALILVAWASIERYILIFHRNLVSTRKKRFFIHYLPLASIVIYCLVFHAVTVLFPPCDNEFHYALPLCGRPICLYEVNFVAIWDTVVNNMLPTLAIVVVSVALLVRVLLQKHRMRQQIVWRRHRKMTIQLLSVSALYFVLYMPPMLVELLQECCTEPEFGADYQLHAILFSYYVICLFPFLSAISLSGPAFTIKKLFPCCHKQSVHPTITTM